MSSSLTWEKVRQNKKTLSYNAKYALRKKYGEPVDTVLTRSDIEYLEGLRDSGMEELTDLIDILYGNEEIALLEEY